jgi:predicted Zn-dependent protease
VRILLVAVLLLAALVTTARVLGTLRDASASREHWRLHDEALVLFEAGRFDEAAARYRAIVAERPTDDVAEFNLGLSLLESDDSEIQAEGWRHIEVVAARDPDFDAAHTKLADRALSAGRDSDAIRHLTRVVAAPPEPAGARAMLAELLVRRGRQGEAIAHFREVVADDRSPPAIRARAALELARQHGRRAEFHRAPASEKTREETAYKQALQIIDGALSSERTEGREELLAMRPFALVARGRGAPRQPDRTAGADLLDGRRRCAGALGAGRGARIGHVALAGRLRGGGRPLRLARLPRARGRGAADGLGDAPGGPARARLSRPHALPRGATCRGGRGARCA